MNENKTAFYSMIAAVCMTVICVVLTYFAGNNISIIDILVLFTVIILFFEVQYLRKVVKIK